MSNQDWIRLEHAERAGKRAGKISALSSGSSQQCSVVCHDSGVEVTSTSLHPNQAQALTWRSWLSYLHHLWWYQQASRKKKYIYIIPAEETSPWILTYLSQIVHGAPPCLLSTTPSHPFPTTLFSLVNPKGWLRQMQWFYKTATCPMA